MPRTWHCRLATVSVPAIKIISPAFTADPERLARFEREARTLAALNHTNIAHVYGLEHSEAGYALVMEVVGGEDLSQRLTHGPLPVDDALPVARQLAEAIEAAHELGIVHRDLKPANINARSVYSLRRGLSRADPGAPTPSSRAWLRAPRIHLFCYDAPRERRSVSSLSTSSGCSFNSARGASWLRT